MIELQIGAQLIFLQNMCQIVALFRCKQQKGDGIGKRQTERQKKRPDADSGRSGGKVRDLQRLLFQH